MRIYVHIGPDGPSSDRMQRVLDAKRSQMLRKGVLYARSPGARNHTRLFMAVTDPDNLDSLRFNRGFIAPDKQQVLYDDVARSLAQGVASHTPDALILSAHQLGSTLCSHSELERLHALLSPLSDDIRIVAHLDDPARMLLRRYGAQLMEGRARGLELELGCLEAKSFWEAALATRPACDPMAGQFGEVQGACFWLDYARLQHEWEAVFGAGAVDFRSLDADVLYSEAATEEVRAAFGIAPTIGKAEPADQPGDPSAAWLARMRLFNDTVLRLLAQKDTVLPRQLWRKFLGEIKVHGAAIAPGSLSALSKRFERDIKALCKAHAGLNAGAMKRDRKTADWVEADPERGFRATQYLMAFRWRINQATKENAPTKRPNWPACPMQKLMQKHRHSLRPSASHRPRWTQLYPPPPAASCRLWPSRTLPSCKGPSSLRTTGWDRSTKKSWPPLLTRSRRAPWPRAAPAM